MRLVSYQKAGEATLGILQDDHVLDLTGAGLPADMTAFLDGGEAALAAARRALEAGGGAWTPLNGVRLLAPVPRPRKLFCLAGNYAEHIIEGGKRLEEVDKVTPRIFMKPPSNTVVGPYDGIVLGRRVRSWDWEVEFAFVIGKRGKHIKADQALDYVVGYTVLNDLSERDLQLKERPDTREWDSFFDWLNGKWCDTAAPMGPCLVTKDEIPDPYNLRISLSVNGEQQQEGNTGQMLFHMGDILEYLTAFLTVEPGDVVATGTPAGVGHGKGLRLQAGDVVRAEIEGLGALENRVVAEQA